MASFASLTKLLENPKTAKFVGSLKHADLPKGWADDPEIVKMAEDAYREMGTQSPFFRAWFRNGITNNEGAPMKLYHGTPVQNVENWAFDPKYIGNHGASEGKGFYTASNPEIAKGYANKGGSVLELYSNSQKMMDVNKGKPLTIPQLKKTINESIQAEAKETAKNEGEKYKPDFLRDTWISNYTDTYNQPISVSVDDVARKIKDYNDTGFDQIEEVIYGSRNFPNATRAIQKATGYEGSYSYGYKGTPERYADEVGDIYVHWFPESLKSTTNRGTFNPDDPNIYKGILGLIGAGAVGAALGSPGQAQASEDAAVLSRFNELADAGALPGQRRAEEMARSVPVTYASEPMRNLSLGARATMEGVLGAPSSLANTIIGPFTDFRFGNPGEALADLQGQAKPVTASEKLASDIVYGAGDALPWIATGAGMAKYGRGIAQGVGDVLKSGPKTQTALGALLGMFGAGSEYGRTETGDRSRADTQ